jgi:hypothetical protein
MKESTKRKTYRALMLLGRTTFEEELDEGTVEPRPKLVRAEGER